MKYSEFRRVVEDMNYNLEEETALVVREKVTDRPIVYVGRESRFAFSLYTRFHELKESEQEDLFNLVTELSKTPIGEREEEKRYRLKFENNLKEIYVLFDKIKADWEYYNNGKFIGDKNRKAIFTESELQDVDETGFTREEVVE